ncbi:MAG: hypothetical protein F6K65_07810 [Moorea sp. SIO3C2]|nr:hypothetical protein [Moorena sp. SIO3C2]
MGETTAVAHGGGTPFGGTASPRPHCLPKTPLHRFLGSNSIVDAIVLSHIPIIS